MSLTHLFREEAWDDTATEVVIIEIHQVYLLLLSRCIKTMGIMFNSSVGEDLNLDIYMTLGLIIHLILYIPLGLINHIFMPLQIVYYQYPFIPLGELLKKNP